MGMYSQATDELVTLYFGGWYRLRKLILNIFCRFSGKQQNVNTLPAVQICTVSSNVTSNYIALNLVKTIHGALRVHVVDINNK